MCSRPMLCCLLVLASPALLADQVRQETQATITDSAANYLGNLSVNQAAGTAHQQINSRAIAAGDSSTTNTRITQVRASLPASATGSDAVARIQGASFSKGSGILGLNQSAGAGNQHSNVVGISLNSTPDSLDDTVLSQSAAPTSVSGAVAPPSGERIADIDDRAFADSRGVVQLNQSAGVGNSSANNLSIRVAD
ncbi:adhesin [Halopseudomonas maritima]|uniref:adhesin n=1 Tax=Halopseudomonas maritima TaxID=2918528 RepID=UPI001EEB6A52|nr:adhesin [Halopseudomonas maritima]UJJ31972.1 adhesin [Halopseudomonas maritima]